MNESTKVALNIFKKVLNNERINPLTNSDLYDEYRFNADIQNDVSEILEIFDIDIYEHGDKGLFITPGVDNSMFGFSKSELKKELKSSNDTELGIHLFIMYCVLTKFYRESSLIKTVDFITAEQVLKSCEEKILIVKSALDKEANLNIESEASFKKLVTEWDSKTVLNLKSKAQTPEDDTTSQSKTAYINRVLRFMCDNDLLHKDEVQRIYMIQPKMEVIVGYYFEENNVKGKIIEYIESVEETLVLEDDTAISFNCEDTFLNIDIDEN